MDSSSSRMRQLYKGHHALLAGTVSFHLSLSTFSVIQEATLCPFTSEWTINDG
jgi:hypothetical protein